MENLDRFESVESRLAASLPICEQLDRLLGKSVQSLTDLRRRQRKIATIGKALVNLADEIGRFEPEGSDSILA